MLATGFSGRVRKAFGLNVTLSLSVAVCLAPAMAEQAKAGDPTLAPMVIERQGSFAAGGKVIGEPGNTLHCDHGVVDYQVPVNARKVGLFFWHSSGAQVWKQRWDGGEGYQSLFLRRGFPVYIWDGPRVGRANWGCEEYTFKPRMGVDRLNFFGWRLGTEKGEWFPNVQFPKDNPEAQEQAMRSRYDEFDTRDNVTLQVAAAAKAIDRIGPTVLVTSSAGGLRALLTATMSDNVKGVVAYETPAYVFPEGEGPQGPTGPIDSHRVPLADFMKLTRIPIQIVWGDNIKGTFWEPDIKLAQQFVDIVNAHGGKAELLLLPSIGIRGNTHLPFADMNNVEIAGQLSLFLEKHKLDLR